MNNPTPDELRLAAEWLRQYEDVETTDNEAEQCKAVADWLDQQADAKELRDAAREHGVPVAALRKRLAKG